MTKLLIVVGAGCVLAYGCADRKSRTGFEYAPQMYHSVPYEPFSQITDTTAGWWASSQQKGPAEFYNSNPYNPSAMTQRLPVEGTVPRNDTNQLPYRLGKDDLETAAATLVNPLANTQAVLTQGEVLYKRFCWHCHGDKGQGDGPVGTVYKGVTAYSSRAVKNATEGHIFHVITHGKGRMRPHGSQISPNDRWKIVRYVQTLQRQ